MQSGRYIQLGPSDGPVFHIEYIFSGRSLDVDLKCNFVKRIATYQNMIRHIEICNRCKFHKCSYMFRYFYYNAVILYDYSYTVRNRGSARGPPDCMPPVSPPLAGVTPPRPPAEVGAEA